MSQNSQTSNKMTANDGKHTDFSEGMIRGGANLTPPTPRPSEPPKGAAPQQPKGTAQPQPTSPQENKK